MRCVWLLPELRTRALIKTVRSVNARTCSGEPGVPITNNFNLTRRNEVDYSFTKRGLKTRKKAKWRRRQRFQGVDRSSDSAIYALIRGERWSLIRADAGIGFCPVHDTAVARRSLGFCSSDRRSIDQIIF
jgi:hypothetical protein